MPQWLFILIQVIETVLAGITQKPPAQMATQEELDAHADQVLKLQKAIAILKS